MTLIEPLESDAPRIDPSVARRVALGMIALIACGAIAVLSLRKQAGPPPAEISGDALLVQGREVYLSRCGSCHGEKGKGDGPIAKGLTGRPVGDLTVPHWKHGDRLDQVREVIALGVPNTNMAGWGRFLEPEDLRAVTAYVYWIAGRSIPDELRKP